ncbi:MAG: PhzF family phenazine biosynthesis protein [Phenylobacterium sp.]|uniref:PhzF family phenazine biosynthesis protein n=1 Tax=Phenylobacterium sp. TaxID=1871053 RepID=UPI00391B3066
MPAFPFVTVDVFTDRRFGGNPLAVFTDARGLSDADMLHLANEMNLSETTFVLPPADPANTARVRIFNTTAEMPFAGHPMIGTGWVLAQRGLGRDGVLSFEVPAGLVEVQATAAGAVISAPRPLVIGQELPVEAVAACASLTAADIVTGAHRPVCASVGVDFAFAEVTLDALSRAAPDVTAFRRALAEAPAMDDQRMSLHLYAREAPGRLRARMFAPLTGTFEDPATGSANATLAALLLSLGEEERATFEIVQGVEMGRPSRLTATATRQADGVRATVGGGCVPVLSGQAEL